MVAVARPRIAQALVVALALVLMVPVVSTARAGIPDDQGRERMLTRLLRLDPGARLGANTQVGAPDGARLLGVPRRTNFILGLGAQQRIVGGGDHDQLGARGAGSVVLGRGGPDLIHGGATSDRLGGGPGQDLIHGHDGADMILGGAGRDLIYGGPGLDRIRSGPGRDRVVDDRGATTVRAGSGRDGVDVADGRGNDRVLCTAGSLARVVADADDQVGDSCRVVTERVVARRPGPAPPARAAQRVTGDGSNDRPFVMDCGRTGLVDCDIGPFPRRTLDGFWANEYVPAYKCPPSNPYLFRQDYAPFGTALPQGVEVRGLRSGEVGVSITGRSTIKVEGRDGRYPTGSLTGPGQSSATNWKFVGEGIYQVILHCTSDPDHSYALMGRIL
jgi:RTX calcium-binding nonapeptide repeat (4 copies)